MGYQVAGIGDHNGDGLSDIVMVAATGSTSYVVNVIYGTSDASVRDIYATDLNLPNPSLGYRITSGNADTSLTRVSGAGDMNGDGIADLVISGFSSPTSTGWSYVVYGSSNVADNLDNLGRLNLSGQSIASSLGFRVTNNAMGESISTAGDFNGDGLDDLIFGQNSTNSSAGRFSILLGGTQWVTDAVSGAGEVNGNSGNEAVIGSAGDDTLTGGGGVDRFFAGAGNDTIVLTASDVANLANNSVAPVKAMVDGGTGFDTIRLTGGANLDLTQISNVGAMGTEERSRIEHIERIDMATDTASNTLTLMARDVKDMAGFNLIRTGSVSADGKTWSNLSGTALSATTRFHQLVVDGADNDTLILAADLGFWTNAGTVSNGTHNYTVYQNAGTLTQVLVRVGVVVNNNDNVAPVVLDLNRDGILSYSQLTMDVNGDGQLDQTAWAGAEDGVLVWDKYADGLVHDNSQYAFAQYAGFAGATDLQGLAAAFDSNGDGVFDSFDALYSQFAVWQDLNQDGVSDEGEVRSLADWGIASINLVSDGVVRAPAVGVQEAGRSTAEMTDGSKMLVADAAFAYRTVTTDEHLMVVRETGAAPATLAELPNLCSLYSGLKLDLSAVLDKDTLQGIVKNSQPAAGALDQGLLTLTLADVLSMPDTDGVHQLVLTGAANDKLMLAEGDWTDSGQAISPEGAKYSVYTGTHHASAQLLIDQQMLPLH
jgi:hypothetical protein